MTQYARIQNGAVVEILSTTLDISTIFAPGYAATFVESDGTAGVAQGWTYANGVFSPPPAPTLAQAQAAQNALVSSACQVAIVGGFTSSALGTASAYPSDVNTQANIITAAPYGGSIWCRGSGGAWAFQAHSAPQAQQVQKDMNAWIQAQQTTYAGLLGEIAAATTNAAVQAVVWP